MKSLAIVLTLASAALAPAQNLRIVNAASLSATSFAPGSIINSDNSHEPLLLSRLPVVPGPAGI